MKKQNWDNIQEATEYERPVPGAYIVEITNVEDIEEKEYLRVEYDFAEGKYKRYYQELFAAKDFWGGSFIRSYKEKALPFFKAFKTSLEVSNRGYCFDEDHLANMRGKLLGVVLGEEEYISNNGEKKTRLYVAQTRSVRAIQDGEFKVPELKRLPDSKQPSDSFFDASGFNDGEIPF